MKRRSESAFSLHFDFHATPSPTGGHPIGATLREEEIREICRLLRPDFIQVDCKGHPGWASYATACKNAVPELVGDPLALWRRVTQEEGVALYVHYSGVVDLKYCAEHPEEAVLHADGTRDEKATRTLGRYVDDLLIPQLKELAGTYGVDGAWVDGECWGTRLDYDPKTLEAFEQETGISLNGKLPVEKDDPHYAAFRDFCREAFRRYVAHYTDALHQAYPDFQIATNWGYSDHMPEQVRVQVDFLSGDLDPWNCLHSARYAGRALAQQGKAWDLMSWNFRALKAKKPAWLNKHPVQLLQEAGAVLALGGCYQNYIPQYSDGAPRMTQIRQMVPLANFVRERQDFCVGGTIAHEAAILLSAYDRYHETPELFGRTGCEKILGLTALFCDCGRSVEFVSEHTLGTVAESLKLIAVPETAVGLEQHTVKALLSYAANGGSLLLVGYHTCKQFTEAGNPSDFPLEVPLELADQSPSGKVLTSYTFSLGDWVQFTLDQEEFGQLKDVGVLNSANGETVAWIGETERTAEAPVAVVLPYGKGKIAAVAADVGSQYLDCTQYLHRALLDKLCERLYRPSVVVEQKRGLLEVVDLRTRTGKRCIQLVNGNGGHLSLAVGTEDWIPPVQDVELSIALAAKPKALIQRPSGRELPFTYENGRARVAVGTVEYHEIVEVVENNA